MTDFTSYTDDRFEEIYEVYESVNRLIERANQDLSTAYNNLMHANLEEGAGVNGALWTAIGWTFRALEAMNDARDRSITQHFSITEEP